MPNIKKIVDLQTEMRRAGASYSSRPTEGHFTDLFIV